MKFVIDIAGDTQLEREMLRVGSYAGDARPVFQVIFDDLVAISRKQFDTQGRYGSGGWKPLKPATIENKARLGLDPRILHATLALRKSLTQKGASQQVRVITSSMLEFGSELEYLKYHQLGAPGANLPQRRAVELPEHDRRSLVKRLQTYIMTGKL